MSEERLRAYIAGPMRGVPSFNFPAFFAAEKTLEQLGFDTINPARLDVEWDGFDPEVDQPKSPYFYMRRDLPLVCDCHLLVLLPGWSRSDGTRKEMRVACDCGIPCIPLESEGLLTAIALRGTTDGFVTRLPNEQFHLKGGPIYGKED